MRECNYNSHTTSLHTTTCDAGTARDGSPRGKKHFLFLNPQIVQPTSGMRVPASEAARQLGGVLLESELQSIFFARSRNQTEVLLKYLRDEARLKDIEAREKRVASCAQTDAAVAPAHAEGVEVA